MITSTDMDHFLGLIEDMPYITATTERPMTTAIDTTLSDRGKRYGSFVGHAAITQNLKDVMASTPNWHGLDDDMKEALEMIGHKIGRILNGDPKYHDSWFDIAGYAKLVADRLETGKSV